ncbi:MAG: hypothetical protein DYG92_10760 [Leptolyngbya sp. PLA1]|nr:hypothetical protein [Leptolyngbya sp. PLA1]
MKSVLRRFAIGLGCSLLVAGVGVFLIGHELMRALIAYAVEDQKQGENAFKAFGAGVLLAAMGAGLLGLALPRSTSRHQGPPASGPG